MPTARSTTRARARRAPLALLALAVLALPAVAQTRRALLVGIDRYAAPTTDSPLQVPFADLEGAVNDARALAEVLRARYGFAREDVVLLTDETATRDGILTAFREHLVEGSGPGDVALFFFAGHGSLIRSSSARSGVSDYDQTLVPHDANTGGLPIWDKEVRRLLGDVLDRGAHVTALFDSCHSGSVTRGLPESTRSRWAPPDPRDAAELFAFVEPDERPAPEDRGAVVISAAQDDESAKERTGADGEAHGFFSDALVRVLRTAPLDETADRVYRRVRATMQAEGARQTPQLGAADVRRPLIGEVPEGRGGGTAVAVLAVLDDGDVLLAGGRAVGLAQGAELAAGDVRLRVTEVRDLTSARAEVVEGDAPETGELFEVVTWVDAAEAHLVVWMPPAIAPERLEAAGAELARLADSPDPRWIDDPTTSTVPPDELTTLRWSGERWELDGPRGLVALPDEWRAEDVARLLPPSAALLAWVPPPVELTDSLQLDGPSSSIEIATRPEAAHYALVGRWTADGPAYAWVRPGASADEDEAHLVLPVRSDWERWSSERASRVAGDLRRTARRIGRVRAWLQLESPPGQRSFPYRLVVRNARTDEDVTGRSLRIGDQVDLLLVADRKPRRVVPRFVYLLAIDAKGESKLVFPAPGEPNRLPLRQSDERLEIPLNRDPIDIVRPVGTDTLVMLTTTEKLSDTGPLQWPPVQSDLPDRGVTRGAGGSALDRLLTSISSMTRSSRAPTPAQWSVERVQFVTREASDGR